VAGNSVGGWTALELAKLGRARSVTALAPAGLWRRRDPFTARAQLWLNHHLSRALSPLVAPILRRAWGRKLFMSGAIGDPRRISPEDAISLARSMGSAPGFSRHLHDTTRVRFEGGQHIAVPVTVAWGDKERLIPARARRQDELPAHTRRVELSGCGHLPFWDAPEETARAIIETAQVAAATA
jgi:pimeloyl-ACP methyl ester carboxylesterase